MELCTKEESSESIVVAAFAGIIVVYEHWIF